MQPRIARSIDRRAAAPCHVQGASQHGADVGAEQSSRQQAEDRQGRVAATDVRGTGEDASEAARLRQRLKRGARVSHRHEMATRLTPDGSLGHCPEVLHQRQRLSRRAGLARHNVERLPGRGNARNAIDHLRIRAVEDVQLHPVGRMEHPAEYIRRKG